MTSPARAGRSADAAKPITVARNAAEKWTVPMGASKYCHRQARMTYVEAVATSAARIRSQRDCMMEPQTSPRLAFRRKTAISPSVRSTMIAVRRYTRMKINAPVALPTV